MTRLSRRLIGVAVLTAVVGAVVVSASFQGPVWGTVSLASTSAPGPVVLEVYCQQAGWLHGGIWKVGETFQTVAPGQRFLVPLVYEGTNPPSCVLAARHPLHLTTKVTFDAGPWYAAGRIELQPFPRPGDATPGDDHGWRRLLEDHLDDMAGGYFAVVSQPADVFNLVKGLHQRLEECARSAMCGGWPGPRKRTDNVIAKLRRIERIAGFEASQKRLFDAVERPRSLTVLNELIDGGTWVNGWNRGGLTPLYMAVRDGLVEHASALFEAGANLEMSWRNRPDTPMATAVASNSLQMMQLLQRPGVEAEFDLEQLERIAALANRAARNRDIGSIQAFLQLGTPVDLAGPEGATPLLSAVRTRSTEITRILIEAGADPRLRDSSGNDAFDYTREPGELRDLLLRHPIPEGGPGHNVTPTRPAGSNR